MNIARRIARMESRIGNGGRRCPECGERIDSQTAMLLMRLAVLRGDARRRCQRCGLPSANSRPSGSIADLRDRLAAIAGERNTSL